MSAEREICQICKSPKYAKGSGSMTEWLTSCRCDVVLADDVQSETLDFCSTCGKRVNQGRAGSFTQFIFRFDLCSCANPGLKPKFRPAAVAEQLASEVEEIQLDPSLSVDEDSFPTERYQPLKAIGTGAGGQVFLCRDRHLNKYVAVKILSVRAREQLVAFQNEARVLSRLDHPNIIRILDFGAGKTGAPYMVLEYTSGTDLKEVIKNKVCLTRDEATDVFSQLLDALIYCHEHGVLHRDLKPQNIIFETVKQTSPVVKLVDFGIAMMEDGDTTEIDGKVIAGTPAYMAPDQVLGLKYDARSEAYSFGCVLFEALTGRPPFIGETVLEVLSRHANDRVPLVSDFSQEEIPGALQKLISKCLEKKPSDRFQSMKEIQNALIAIKEEGAKAAAINGEEAAREVSDSPVSTSRVGASQLNVATVCSIVLIVVTCFSMVAYQSLQNQSAVSKAKQKKRTANTAPKFAIYNQEADVYELSGEISRAVFKKFVEEYDPGAVYFASDAKVDWSGLEELQKCKHLIYLSVSGSNLSDEDCALIAGLPVLRELNLSETKVTDIGIENLDGVPTLRTLIISSTNVTGACLKHLANLPVLSQLDMENVEDITIAQLSDLRRLAALRRLDVSSLPLGDGAIDVLGNLKLTKLSMDDCGITDSGIAKLSKMPVRQSLAKITISDNPGITDKAIPYLLKMPRLEVIKIGLKTGITKRGEGMLEKNGLTIKQDDSFAFGKQKPPSAGLTELEVADPNMFGSKKPN